MHNSQRQAVVAIAIYCTVVATGCGSRPAADEGPGGGPQRVHYGDVKEDRKPWGVGWGATAVPVVDDRLRDEKLVTFKITAWVEAGPFELEYQLPGGNGAPATGTMSIPALRTGKPAICPVQGWKGGATEAAGTGLWLTNEALDALRQGQPVTCALVSPGRGAAQRSVTLNKVKSGMVTLKVRATAVPFKALSLADDLGSTYSVLDNDLNPLVIRFRAGADLDLGGVKIRAGDGFDVRSLSGP